MINNQKGVVPILILMAIVGVIAFLGIGALGLSNNSVLKSIFPVFFSRANTVTNLLTNGDFMNGMQSWTLGQNTNATVTTDAHSPTQAVHFVGTGSFSQNFSGIKPSTQYKVTFWVKLNSATKCSATGNDCWGDFRASLGNNDWQGQFDGPDAVSVSLNNTPVNTWVKKSFTFSTTKTATGYLMFHNYSSAFWNWDVNIDDVMMFEVPTTPLPPTAAVSADVTSINSTSQAINFKANADDVDGNVAYYFWDFGDGGKANIPDPQYKYGKNGTFPVTLRAYDDSGLSAVSTVSITVNDPSLAKLTVSNPTSLTVDTTTSAISIAGTAQAGSGKTITKVEYSNDRGGFGQATGTTNWSASLNLGNQTGINKILVTAYENDGTITSKTITVNYKPSTKISIQNGAAGVSQNSNSIEQYEKFEATFNVVNGLFSNPYFPYEANLPDGMKKDAGVTIEATFTSPSGKTLKQPAFLYQNYQRVLSTKQLIAQGEPVWKIRFSPTELGTWTYSISLTDLSGNTVVSDNSKLTFNAVSPTNRNNHGFLQVSQKDKRYFEFSDGTPFIGVGPSAGINSDSSFDTDTALAQIGADSANFSRTWMSGAGISGGSWVPWGGGLGYDGNVPKSGLTTEQVYADGLFSLKLTAPTGPACAFYGWNALHGQTGSVKPNTNYRVMARIKTVGITGTGGFTIRHQTPWPDNCNVGSTKPLTMPFQTGTQDWHVATGTWSSGGSTKLGILLMTLENVTAGTVYIDEVSVREDLGNGTLGPEVLMRSKMNIQDYFTQEPSWNWDYGLDEFAKRGLYQKPVITEKQDPMYNAITPSGFALDKGNQLQAGGAARKYQEYYWRYLIARYGYSRAIHSWEYANEQAPGDLTLGNALAKYMEQNDPNRHMANSSNWGSLNGRWADPQFSDIDYADAHAYVNDNGGGTTSWLGLTDPFTNSPFANDTALFPPAHSIDQFNKNAAGNKPMVIGESGTGTATIIAGYNDGDTQGVWWHQFIWPQMNHGGAYFIYWFDTSLKNRNLFNIAVPYRQFMEGKTTDTVNTRIPLNNGNYKDIKLNLPSGLRGWGQKDIVGGGAHFWVYDTGYTWLTPSGGASLGGKTISFDELPTQNYLVEFWDTWTGTVTKQNVNHPGGTMTVTVPAGFNQKDVGVKIYPVSGYSRSQASPVPNPSSSLPVKVGDIVINSKVDLYDYNALLTDFGKKNDPVTPADLDDDNDVDLYDYNILLTNFGR